MTPALANTSHASALKKRAEMLFFAREFFAKRNILEIDVPALIKCPPIDSNIDCIEIKDFGYLHTSPEYLLKRLLSSGIGDCFFLGHVFRKDERGRLHNPEFTMAEWYRLGFSLDQMIHETAEFLSLFFGSLPVEKITYIEAFQKYVGIDIDTASLDELQKLTTRSWDFKTCTQYLLAEKIEPHLGKNQLTALTHYPQDEAALATLAQKDGRLRAERFEIYHQGVELANGYHELSDAQELTKRFDRINQFRAKEEKDPYPLDERFLASLKDLPACSGVALGFDRSLMLMLKRADLSSILPFSWDKI